MALDLRYAWLFAREAESAWFLTTARIAYKELKLLPKNLVEELLVSA
jgi:hypothetical protein